jgi:hypothetical protein
MWAAQLLCAGATAVGATSLCMVPNLNFVGRLRENRRNRMGSEVPSSGSYLDRTTPQHHIALTRPRSIRASNGATVRVVCGQD